VWRPGDFANVGSSSECECAVLRRGGSFSEWSESSFIDWKKCEVILIPVDRNTQLCVTPIHRVTHSNMHAYARATITTPTTAAAATTTTNIHSPTPFTYPSTTYHIFCI
jgi:hypothetical protein